MTELIDKAQLNKLYQYAYVLSQCPSDAYDLLQSALEAYLVTVQRGREEIKNPDAYLRTLIRNRYIDHYRHGKRWQQESYEETKVYDISPLDLESVSITEQELENVWGLLKPQERELLYYWAVLGYSTDEACELLEVPRGTFLTRLYRLRKRLKAERLLG